MQFLLPRISRNQTQEEGFGDRNNFEPRLSSVISEYCEFDVRYQKLGHGSMSLAAAETW